MYDRTAVLLVLAASLASPLAALSQTAPSPEPTPTGQSGDPDAQVVGIPPATPLTPAQKKDLAWKLLTGALADQKHPEIRTQALAALGMLGENPRSLAMMRTAMQDHDLDVRTAAVLAAGQTHAPAIAPAMRQLLDDREPQVAFAAALALAKMGDASGEDILMAVVDGERRAAPTLLNGTEHTIDKDLHSPSTLARIGVTEGAGMLLGPFGIGLAAYEYIHKNGGDSARVTAIETLAREHTEPLRNEFLAALTDKDPAVRAAAAKALSSWRQASVADALAKLFYDSKAPVRYTAAASYLISSGASSASPDANGAKHTTRKR